jgi:hypothetical protein
MENILFQIGNNVITAVSDKYERFIELSPFILGAIAVFLFGWILAEVTARAIINLGHKIHLHVILEKIGLEHFLSKTRSKLSPSELLAKGVKGYLIFLFFIESTRIARLTKVADFLAEVINYVPDVLIAVFIMLVGMRIGHTMEILISTSLSLAKDATSHVLGVAAKYTVFTFAVLAALNQLEIAPILVQIMFVGFIAMLALAGGLAFGLGGKDVVKEILEAFKKMELKTLKKRR